MRCEWLYGECVHCGYVQKHEYPNGLVRQCTKPRSPTLIDYNLTADGDTIEVRLFRPRCLHLGERTENRAKTSCKTLIWTPIYRCARYRRATPFGKSVDSEIIHPCPGCKEYEPCPT